MNNKFNIGDLVITNTSRTDLSDNKWHNLHGLIVARDGIHFEVILFFPSEPRYRKFHCNITYPFSVDELKKVQ